jgi:hypothetical protein
MKKILTSLTITFLLQAVMIAQTEEATIKENNVVKDSLIKMTENSTPAILKQDSAYTETTDGNSIFETSSFGDPPASGMDGNDPKLNDTKTKTNAPVNYGEKFCDVKVMDGKVVVENYFVNGEKNNYEVNNLLLKSEEMKNLQIIYIRESDMIYLRGDHGLYYVKFFVDGAIKNVEVAGLGFPTLISSKFVKGNDNSLIVFTTEKTIAIVKVGEWPPQTFAHDGSEFFTHKGAVYEDLAKGIIVATTPTTLFVKVKDKIQVINYNLQFGEGPALEKPIIDLEGVHIRIRDLTMSGDGTTFKIIIDPATMKMGICEESVSFR